MVVGPESNRNYRGGNSERWCCRTPVKEWVCMWVCMLLHVFRLQTAYICVCMVSLTIYPLLLTFMCAYICAYLFYYVNRFCVSLYGYACVCACICAFIPICVCAHMYSTYKCLSALVCCVCMWPVDNPTCELWTRPGNICDACGTKPMGREYESKSKAGIAFVRRSVDK